jgi:Zn-finger protein
MQHDVVAIRRSSSGAVTMMTVLVAVSLAIALALASSAGATYITWSSTGANAGTGGPHQNYQLATQKCSVCHSVHYAAVPGMSEGGWSVPATATDTEMLLRSSVADACTYCHIDTNLGGLQIYGGIPSRYQTDDVYGHNGSSAARCADCHAVHGADTFGGAIARKILKRGGTPANTSGNVQVEAAATYAALNGGDLFGGSADVAAQSAAFCTECHKVFSSASEQTITASGFTWSGSGGMQTFTNKSYKNHPLKGADANLSAQGATYSGRAAWDNASYCRSCHAAGLIHQAGVYTGLIISSYPHYTPDRARFLTAGWGAADVNATAIGAGNVVNDPSADGVCLRCHRNGSNAGDSTGGVGVTF